MYVACTELNIMGVLRAAAVFFCILHLTDVVLGQFVFNQSVYTATLEETKPVSQNVLSLHCIESNSSSNSSNITYNITASSPSVPFMVNSSTGIVYLSAGLDYENQTSYTFTVACSSSVGPSASASVEITVLPVNEFDPIARLIGMSPNTSSDATILVLHENDRSAGDIFISSTPGAGEVLLEASDNDAGLDGTLRFNLSVSGLPSGLESPFVINSTTGEVSFKQTLNGDVPGRNDTYIFFKVEIIACDLGEPNRCYTSNTVNVFLFLTDDNLPEFVQQSFTVSIPEDDTSTVGMAVVQATCIDDDSGPGELDSVSIVNPSAQLEGLLSIPDPKTGNVVLKHVLDYEKNESINFMLRCQDTANNTDYANVTITVEPRNDNKPTFDHSEYRFNVSCETWNLRQSIGTVEATDEDIDIGNNLTYSIQNSNFFTIDSNGRIFLLPSIQNANGLFALTVSVNDGQFSTSVPVLLILLCGPTNLYFVLPSQVLARLDEHTPINTPLRKVTCNSTFSSSRFSVSYSLVSGNTENTFNINSTSGVIVLARPLPALNSNTFSLVVQCSAGGSAFVDTTTVVVLVEDTLFDYQLPLICALGAVLVAFLVLGCIFVIVIAVRKISSSKKRSVPKMIEDGENPSVVLRRMQPSRSEVNLPKRITPYLITYKTPENEGRTNSGYEIMTGQNQSRVEPALYESLPGTPSREGALSLSLNNPAYVSSNDLKKLATNAPSGGKLPASESGYFESTQQSQALEEAQLAAERPTLSASLPSIPVIIVSSAQHMQQ